MSVDEMIEELHGFIVDEDFLNRIKDLLIKIKGRLSNIVSKQ